MLKKERKQNHIKNSIRAKGKKEWKTKIDKQ